MMRVRRHRDLVARCRGGRVEDRGNAVLGEQGDDELGGEAALGGEPLPQPAAPRGQLRDGRGAWVVAPPDDGAAIACAAPSRNVPLRLRYPALSRVNPERISS
jgi:hypothetical protein